MSAAGSIFLSDATDPTPVAREFEPARAGSDYFQWEHRTSGVYAGYDKCSIQLIRPSGPVVEGQNRNIKAIVKLETPLLKTLSTGGAASGYTAAPAVDYRLVAELRLTFPEQCTEQNRKDLRRCLSDLIGNEVPMDDLFERYELPY